MAEKQDVYSRVTDKIIKALEQGVRPWHKPWNAEHAAGRITRPLRGNGEPYNGINILMLWSEAVDKGYSAPIWMTYRQATELGGQVRKGEKGTTVVYANRFTVTETDKETGEDQDRKIPFLKAYAVFNVEQIDGLPACYYAMDEGPRLDPDLRNLEAENFIAATKADIRHGGNVAAYSLSLDRILMPHFEFFETPLAFYGCVVHELTHWVRHPSRLNRDFGRKRWGDAGYAMEELVAELGSAFLCADLNLTPQIEDHAAYLDSWLVVLKRDKRAIFTAASHAQRAADYLHGLQPDGPLRPAPDRPSETPQEAGRLPLVPQGENSLAPPPFKDQLDLDL